MKQPDEMPKLSEMEWEVLKPLWAQGPLAARDIYAAIPAERGWAYKTVKTMIARLVKKGVLEYEQVGNSYLYRAKYSREEMTRSTVGRFLHRVFDGTVSPFVSYFAEEASADELRAIREALEKLERRKREAGQ